MAGIRLGVVCAASVLTIVLVAAAGAAHAYTPEQQQACSGDAFRLCSQDIPDIERVTACMVRNKALLSPECRAQFGPEPSETVAAAPAGRPLSIRPAKASKAKKPVRAKSHKTTNAASS